MADEFNSRGYDLPAFIALTKECIMRRDLVVGSAVGENTSVVVYHSALCKTILAGGLPNPINSLVSEQNDTYPCIAFAGLPAV